MTVAYHMLERETVMKPIRRRSRPRHTFVFDELEGAPTLVDFAKELLQKSQNRISVSRQLLSERIEFQDEASQDDEARLSVKRPSPS